MHWGWLMDILCRKYVVCLCVVMFRYLLQFVVFIYNVCYVVRVLLCFSVYCSSLACIYNMCYAVYCLRITTNDTCASDVCVTAHVDDITSPLITPVSDP